MAQNVQLAQRSRKLLRQRAQRRAIGSGAGSAIADASPFRQCPVLAQKCSPVGGAYRANHWDLTTTRAAGEAGSPDEIK